MYPDPAPCEIGLLPQLGREVRRHFSGLVPDTEQQVTRFVGGLASHRLVLEQPGDGSHHINEQIDLDALRRPWDGRIVVPPPFFTSATLTKDNQLVDIRPRSEALPCIIGPYIAHHLLTQLRCTSNKPLGWWDRIRLRYQMNRGEAAGRQYAAAENMSNF